MAPTSSEIVKEARDNAVTRVSVHSLASTARRTTCDICRERKVRCDRTKPECLRCRRFGSICTYPSPDAEASRIRETLHTLSKRLEDAESKLQSHQPLVHTGTPVSASESQMLNFTTADLPALGSSADTCEDTDFHPWYWDQPMVESLLPDGMLSQGIEAADPPVTAFSSLVCDLEQGIGNDSTNQPMVVEQSSPPDNDLGIYPVAFETCARLYEAYFHVVQKHLPLINRDLFYSALKRTPEKHQILALKYAVCMAGSRVENTEIQLTEQYYVAARYHLEQAELGTCGSSFWSSEAAQALVLVARFEFEHFDNPRATITMSRLFALMSVLGHNTNTRSLKGQNLDEEELSQWKIISRIIVSMKLQELCLVGNRCLKNHAQPLAVSSNSDHIDLGRTQINLLTSSLTPSENELFDILCESLKIAIDAQQHHRMTSAAVAGVDSPTFNFCRDHERIETRIKTLVTKWLTSSPTSALSSGPNCELRVLALVAALGTRIQLFETASYHGRKSRFLSTISSECHEEGVSSAVDISDLLSFAEVLSPDKITIYREANFYLMPPLRLAAEVLVNAIQAPGHEGARRISHRHLEIQQALNTIVQVMDACKNEAGTYDEFLAKSCALLEMFKEKPTPLRTRFSASSSLGKI